MSICFYFQVGTDMQDLLDPEEQKIIDSLDIDLQTLQTATGNFSLDNILGQGGFHIVIRYANLMLRAVLVSGFISYAVLKYMSPYCTRNSP